MCDNTKNGCVADQLRGRPLEITGGEGGEKFSVHEFFYIAQCLQDFSLCTSFARIDFFKDVFFCNSSKDEREILKGQVRG